MRIADIYLGPVEHSHQAAVAADQVQRMEIEMNNGRGV